MAHDLRPSRPATKPPRRAPRDRPMSAGHVVLVGVIALGLAALLNSQTLLDMANRQPFNSATRGIALALTKPLHSVASAFQLTRPGEAIAEVRGGREGGTGTFDATATTVAGQPAPTGAADDPAEAAPAATTAPGSTATSTPRVPTKDDKLRLYIAGDSQAQGIGES